MSDWNRQPPDEEQIARAVRELSGVEADAGFRERLRDEFTTGRIAARPQTAPPARRRGLRLRWAIPALAVAALLGLFVLNRAPSPRVVATAGTGAIRIDDATFDMADRDAWTERLRPGARVETAPDAAVDILVEGIVLYEVAGSTRMTIPPSPGRWFNSAVECSLFTGELRIKTGPGFRGRTWRVHTPDGLAVVSGTLISVQCSPGGTCVCVQEGIARVGVDEGDLEMVRPGYRKIMLRDGTKEIIPIEPTHRDDLIEFDARIGATVRE